MRIDKNITNNIFSIWYRWNVYRMGNKNFESKTWPRWFMDIEFSPDWPYNIFQSFICKFLNKKTIFVPIVGMLYLTYLTSFGRLKNLAQKTTHFQKTKVYCTHTDCYARYIRDYFIPVPTYNLLMGNFFPYAWMLKLLKRSLRQKKVHKLVLLYGKYSFITSILKNI